MATMGQITYYATKVAYDLKLSLGEGYVRSGIPTELSGGYLGQVITNTAGNEYYIVNRGTANWANALANIGIAVGTFFGLGFETATLASARGFARDQFLVLAEKLAAGQQIDEIILTGHSLGYAESLAQYETLVTLRNNATGTEKALYEQLLSKVRIVGVNGAGLPNSSLSAAELAALNSIAMNFA